MANRVKFVFDGTTNRELPQIVGQLPVLPKHYWEGKDFERTTLEPPFGSGPYRIKSVDAGRSITFDACPTIGVPTCRSTRAATTSTRSATNITATRTSRSEAFKAGRFDLRVENTSRFWATGYEGPALRQGLDHQAEIPTERRSGMQGFVFNTRRRQVPGPAGAAGAGLRLRFRMDQQEPVLRRL